MRKVAAHWVVAPDKTYQQAVVVLSEGRVVEVFTFTEELPFTEWFPGTITVKQDADGTLRAYYQDTQLT